MFITGLVASQCPNRNEAGKSLATLAVSSFDIPGDPRFPLNAFMTKPANRGESGMYVLARRAGIFSYDK